jgi:succinyl-CoA synthetase beta subunit
MTSNHPDQEIAAAPAGQPQQPQQPQQPPADEQAIVADIEHTRAELAETVGELAAKADVKARARTAAAGLRERSTRAAARIRQQAVAGGYWAPAASVAAGLVLLVLVVRNARRR